MEENFRVILTCDCDKLYAPWSVVKNPKWNPVTRGQSAILDNEVNDYAEYKNCGVIYRMIRVTDWNDYERGSLEPEWTLNPSFPCEKI